MADSQSEMTPVEQIVSIDRGKKKREQKKEKRKPEYPSMWVKAVPVNTATKVHGKRHRNAEQRLS